MAQHIKSNHKIREVKPADGKHWTLAELQALVGGYIEMVRLPKHSEKEGREMVLIVNEDGKVKNLPINMEATLLWEENYGRTDVIVGDVLYCAEAEMKSGDEDGE